MLNAFVDESGDRGASKKSSPYFMMGAVTVDDQHRPELANAIASIKREFGIPVDKPLHWTEHCKRFDRRQFTAEKLADIAGAHLNFVIVKKATIPENAALGSDHSKFYNYTAGMLMDRILLGAQHWPGGAQPVRCFFGHVRGMDHGTTRDYFAYRSSHSPYANWGLIEGEPKFIATSQNSGVQAADQYVGMLRDAISEDQFGGYEPQHLLRVRHLIRRGPNGQALNFGLKALAEPGFPSTLPWWPRQTRKQPGAPQSI